MIEAICPLTLMLFFLTLFFGCGRKRESAVPDESEESEGPPPVVQTPKQPLPELPLMTCIDEEPLQEAKTQVPSIVDEGVSKLVWELAGEAEGAESEPKTTLPKDTVKKPETQSAPKEAEKKLEIPKEKVRVKKSYHVASKDQRPSVAEKKDDKTASKDQPESVVEKKDEDPWAGYNELQETQKEDIEYLSIMAPVDLKMMEGRENEPVRIGSLGDLIGQLAKAKAAKAEKAKKTRTSEDQPNVKKSQEGVKFVAKNGIKNGRKIVAKTARSKTFSKDSTSKREAVLKKVPPKLLKGSNAQIAKQGKLKKATDSSKSKKKPKKKK